MDSDKSVTATQKYSSTIANKISPRADVVLRPLTEIAVTVSDYISVENTMFEAGKLTCFYFTCRCRLAEGHWLL